MKKLMDFLRSNGLLVDTGRINDKPDISDGNNIVLPVIIIAADNTVLQLSYLGSIFDVPIKMVVDLDANTPVIANPIGRGVAAWITLQGDAVLTQMSSIKASQLCNQPFVTDRPSKTALGGTTYQDAIAREDQWLEQRGLKCTASNNPTATKTTMAGTGSRAGTPEDFVVSDVRTDALSPAEIQVQYASQFTGTDCGTFAGQYISDWHFDDSQSDNL